MGWLEEISFRDKPTIAINRETCHACCVCEFHDSFNFPGLNEIHCSLSIGGVPL
jgi:hypothetical protein